MGEGLFAWGFAIADVVMVVRISLRGSTRKEQAGEVGRDGACNHETLALGKEQTAGLELQLPLFHLFYNGV